MHRRILAGSALMFICAFSCCGESHALGSGAQEKIVGASRNPFKHVRYFLNPDYIAEVESTAQKHPDEAAAVRKVERYPTAVWLDSIAAVGNLPRWLDAAKKEQLRTGQPTLTVVVIYDLPNRDCAAQASLGELKVAENGESRYRQEFIDPIAQQFRAHPGQPIVVILEPDSLANLATNLGMPRCREAEAAYRSSIAYALRQFRLKNISVYLDAAHSCWLGWDGNREKIAGIFREVLDEAGGPEMVHGFAINTANYNHLGDVQGAANATSSACLGELAYARALRQTLAAHGIKGSRFIIDTSRNGRDGIRADMGSWCNVHGAGLGERPRAEPVPGIDAYFWIKPPGESDGVSDPKQARMDAMCASPDAAKNAPQASQWFDSYFLDLVHNASPPL